ncbi:PAS domain S-box protein [Chloroflexota bacterium]
MKSDAIKKGRSARQSVARRERSPKTTKTTNTRRTPPIPTGSSSIQPEDASLTRMLETLKPHDHLCLIYESQEEWRAAAVPFLSIGLKHGEKCIYVVDTSTADEIHKYLAEEGIDVAAAEKSGQLSILHETEAYTRKGSFDPDKMIALLVSETEKAVAEGYPALRVTGEMTWVLHGHPGSERLLEYEAKLNRDLFPKYPCLAICQYDRWKFDPEVIKGVIMTHPLLVRGNNIYRNLYYVPPEEFLNRKRAEAEVQHWLNNIERERQIQETLRRSELEKTTILATMPELVVYQDLEHRVVWANKAAGESVGLAPEDLVGRYCYEVWQQRSLPCVNCPLVPARETGKPQENEASSPDGRFWLVRGYPVTDHDGVVRGVIEVTHDITERKKAEEILRRNEERFRLLYEGAPLAYQSLDAGGCFIDVNQAWLNTMGYSREEVIGKRFSDFLAPHELEAYKKRFPEFKAGGEVQVDVEVVRKNCSHAIMAIIGKIGYDAHGHFKQTHCILIDITERKQTEERILVANERLEYLMSSSSVVIYSAEAHGNYAGTFISGNVAQLTGYESREFTEDPKFWYNRIHPDDREPVATEIPKIFEKDLHSYEYRFRCKDGDYIWLRDEMKLIRDEKGNPVEIIGVWSDITERKKAERELQEEHRKLQEAQALGRIGNWEYDVDSQTVTWSDETYVLYEHDPAFGPPSIEEEAKYYSADQARALRDYAARSIENGEEFKYDLDAILPSGKRTAFAASMRPIKNESGRVIRLFGTVQDITERKRAEEELNNAMEELRRSNAELERFAYVASHDLQEPLRMVSSYMQLLERRYKDKLDADANDFIDFALGGAERMHELLNNLLVYSRVGTKTKPFKRTDMEAVLQATLDNLQVAIKESKAKVSHDPLPTVMADEGQMVQVLQNLIGNAVKFRGEKQPLIHVSAEQRDSEWVFSVKDNGIGIEPQYFDRIFLIFQRLHREEYPGTGAGLAIAKKIIERHGGRMWIESQPGKGSTFYFSIKATGGRQQAVGKSNL